MEMSRVSGVTLCTSCLEEDDDDGNSVTWSQVNAWLKEHDLESLARVETQHAGKKAMQQCIGIGGYNWFHEDDFAAFVMSINWNSPEGVALVIQPEEGHTRVWMPREGKDPRPALTVKCWHCGTSAGQWCYLPGSTWPLCDERGKPEPEE